MKYSKKEKGGLSSHGQRPWVFPAVLYKMFYRYEAKNDDGDYEGIFSFFNPDHRRYFNRFLREPKWYQNNPDIASRCWFTEAGYQKYHHVIDDLIIEAGIRNVRLLTREELPNIVCRGKIQCIERVYEGEQLAFVSMSPADIWAVTQSTSSAYETIRVP